MRDVSFGPRTSRPVADAHKVRAVADIPLTVTIDRPAGRGGGNTNIYGEEATGGAHTDGMIVAVSPTPGPQVRHVRGPFLHREDLEYGLDLDSSANSTRRQMLMVERNNGVPQENSMLVPEAPADGDKTCKCLALFIEEVCVRRPCRGLVAAWSGHGQTYEQLRRKFFYAGYGLSSGQ